MVPILQPYQVTSPGGRWVLDVIPSNREGSGPAATSLTNTKTGEIAWKQILPYTFWQSCVNDDGKVAGFAYTKGVMGENNSTNDAGEFIVSILDFHGEQMHKETTKRISHSFGLGLYAPSHGAYSIHYDGNNDRMILLMSNGLFRCYNMLSRSLHRAFIPESNGDASGYEWPDEMHFIPNTHLILLQSNSARGSSDQTTSTSCIQLIDHNGRTLWATSKHRTFGADKKWPFPEFRIIDPEPLEKSNDVDPFADSDPFANENPFATTEATDGPGEPTTPYKVADFEVYFGDTGEKAIFKILDSGGNDGSPSYTVVESSREKWTPSEAPVDGEDPDPPKDFPAMAARKLSAFQLKRANGTPLTDIAALALGPDDTIHALDEDKNLIHVFDKDGKFLYVCDSGKDYILDTSYYSSSIAVDKNGEVFARISEYLKDTKGENSLAGHYLRFSADGTLNEKTLTPPADGLSGNIVAQPITNNLIFYGYSGEVAVNSRDKYGNRVATITHRPDGQWLESINNVACAPNGMIAIRDSSMGNRAGGFTTPFPRLPSKLPEETVNIYSKEGEPIRTIDFTRFAGLSVITFDGKHIVATFPWDPPTPLVYVFESEGTPVGAIRIAELAKKKRVNLRPFIVSDGKAILAIDQISGMAFRYPMP